MSVQTDLAEIKAAIVAVEAEDGEAQRTLRRRIRRLHNLLAEKLLDNAELLGLSESDMVALGGGTPKEEDDEEGGD